ncbi:MAG: cupin domain-containing protein, partial [Venatoribacter sp.]
LVEHFEQSASYVLNPGDMLYLPPKLAHWGIAQGECMTYSVGYRAPNLSELIQAAADTIAADASDDARYQDDDLEPQSEPGLIDEKAALRLKKLLTQALDDTENLQAILGRLMTEPKYAELLPETDDSIEWEEIS